MFFSLRLAGFRTGHDLRYLFMRGLMSHEDNQRSRHYLKSAAECTSRAIVSLELSELSILSVKQAQKLEGIGGETCQRLTKLETEKAFSGIKPLGGRFVSSAGGILVGLLDATEEILHNGHKEGKDVLVPEDNVRRRAERLTEETFADNITDFCKPWWRLEVLIKRGYIRRRSLKKSPVLQLLPRGKTAALHLRERVGLTSTVPTRPSVTSTATVPQLPQLAPSVDGDLYDHIPTISSVNTGETTQLEHTIILDDTTMYTSDKEQDGLVMYVDRREMGGEKYGLGELCRLLDGKGLRYKVVHLKTGDYSWVWRTGGREIILPCLVERKRADDIAETLKDGRFWSQVNNMKDWKAEFTKKGVESTIHYILERKPEEFVVKCSDGCQGIKKCGNPTLQQVQSVIEDLKHHPDLLVKETPSLEVTAILLASFTNDLRDRLLKGDFDCLLQQDLSVTKVTKSLSDVNENKSGVGVKRHPSSRYGHDVSSSLKEPLKTGTYNSDLEIDEEMEMVLEKSKFEVRKTEHMDLVDVGNVKKAGFGVIDGANSVRDNNDVVDDKYDEELAMALERSKYDTGGVNIDNNEPADNNLLSDNCAVANNNHLTNNNVPADNNQLINNNLLSDRSVSDKSDYLPLMQYHCSDGGSVYSTKVRDKHHDRDINEYRPRRSGNKATTVSTSTISKFHNIDHNLCNDESYKPKLPSTVQTITQISDMVDHKQMMSDSKSGLCNQKDVESVTDSGSTDVRREALPNASAKRKHSRTCFSFEPSPDNVVNQPTSRCNNNVRPCKKSKTVSLNFTPSKDCIEKGVSEVNASRGKSSNTSKRYKPVGSNFMADFDVEDNGDCKRNKKVNTKSKSRLTGEGSRSQSDQCVEDYREICEVTDSHEGVYDSEKDLFADSDDSNDSCGNGTSKQFNSKCYSDVNENGYRRQDTGREFYDEVIDVRTRNVTLNDSSDSSNDSLPDIGLDINGSSEEVKPEIIEITDSQTSSHEPYDFSGQSSHTEIHVSGTASHRSYHNSGKTVSPVDNMSDKVNLVLSVLPHLDKYTIIDSLSQCNMNVDLCVTQLLDET